MQPSSHTESQGRSTCSTEGEGVSREDRLGKIEETNKIGHGGGGRGGRCRDGNSSLRHFSFRRSNIVKYSNVDIPHALMILLCFVSELKRLDDLCIFLNQSQKLTHKPPYLRKSSAVKPHAHQPRQVYRNDQRGMHFNVCYAAQGQQNTDFKSPFNPSTVENMAKPSAHLAPSAWSISAFCNLPALVISRAFADLNPYATQRKRPPEAYCAIDSRLSPS